MFNGIDACRRRDFNAFETFGMRRDAKTELMRFVDDRFGLFKAHFDFAGFAFDFCVDYAARDADFNEVDAAFLVLSDKRAQTVKGVGSH